ncbi:MAG: hypothetical protein N0E59_16035, partial [Candidatus Thiodiazotropha taylori]|nr:hypothetical protein [Candidatus Thiodiazotropha taylori]MCW4284624.1 hypothetical protein [Candidatus Thiodiazotropha taylori]
INGQQYTPGESQNMQNDAPNQAEQNRTQNRQYKQNSIQNQQSNSRNSSDQQFLIGRKFSRPKYKAQSNMSRPNDSATGITGNTHNRNTDLQLQEGIFTSNTYMVLGNLENDEQTTTPNCAGKKKATSPLDADLTLKKQKDFTSDNESVQFDDSVRLSGTDETVTKND